MSRFRLLPAFLSSFALLNPPFEDELMKKAFQVIVSSFQALPDTTDDIFHHLLALMQGDHSPLLLAHVESILMGVLDEEDDLLLEFFISILSRSQAMANPSSIAYEQRSISDMCIPDSTTTNHFIYR